MQHQVAELLDAARNVAGIATDMALAERLSKSRQLVSQWRLGERVPEDDDVLRLCKLAGVDPGEWLIRMAALRSHGPAARIWRDLADD